MSSANTVDAAAQAGAPSPVQQTASPTQQQATQTQPTQTTQQPQSAGVPSPTAPAAPTGANNTYVCQWTNCGEPCANAESLYEHVCEKHVGRKSTNNLNLTCAWGNCHTTTVKRDHITSHIRVHVPLKPHKCDLCGKSFKRPQDLKKHVKTHAEDPGAMMRGPHDGAGAPRQHQNGYGNMGPQGRLGGYPDAYGGMPGNGVGYGYPGQPGAMGHYAPTAQAGGPGHYGQVYYPAAASIGNHAAYDKGSAFNSLEHLFGAIKNRQFDPSNYQEVSHHLMGLQNMQLPIPMSSGGGYEHGGNGGGVYGPASAHYAQNLPSFSNLRTKQDLTFIEDYLNQMTATAYDNVHQMGANTAVPTGYAPRHSNSPPTMHGIPPSTHSQDMHMTPGGNSPPALTPGSSSAMSYTSGHSPTSQHSHIVSPTTSHPSYPTLPTVTDGPNAGMPASTLGQQYDHDLRRRWSGGNLQRAQPARRNSNDMDIDTPENPTEAKTESKKSKTKRDANIDPLLAGSTTSSSSAASDRTVTPPREGQDRDETWVENMRLLERIKDFVKDLLARGEYADEEPAESSEDSKTEEAKMEEALASAPETEEKPEEEEKKDVVEYPALKLD